MSGPARAALRLSVSGPAQLELEIDPQAGTPTAGAASAGDVRVVQLPMTVEDRALGRRRFEAIVRGWRFEVSAEPADRARLRERAAHVAAVGKAVVALRLRAQIPGRITRLWVANGEQVEQGQRLLAIEAMKMENEIRAPRAGVVGGLAVGEGQLVELGHELLTID
jgi:biotin carboxyl carrier protein